MIVMRYDYADFIPSRSPYKPGHVGDLVQAFSDDVRPAALINMPQLAAVPRFIHSVCTLGSPN